MGQKATDYTLQELMLVEMSREVKNGDLVIIGTGVPLLGVFLAQKTHAPEVFAVTEAGPIGVSPERLPFSVADPSFTMGALMVGGLLDSLGLIHAGRVDLGFLGGAQIDRFGNLNTTCIGDYHRPISRLPGSGGGNDIASCCKRTVISMVHRKDKFVERLDYLTTPGFLGGGDERSKLGFPGSGPLKVVSNLGVFRFDENTKEMYIASYHPWVSIEQIKENTGWDIKVGEGVMETEPPTAEQINLLRQLDPNGVFLQKK
ncbi:MAG: CoA-transferase subunit beta [Firmicutes bacterium]|nr:CoA-transferase subunit beta [Bacillota bacterium]